LNLRLRGLLSCGFVGQAQANQFKLLQLCCATLLNFYFFKDFRLLRKGIQQ
jgi:hypothetical protein